MIVKLVLSIGLTACAKDKNLTLLIVDQNGHGVKDAEVRAYIPYRGNGMVQTKQSDSEGTVFLTYSSEQYIDYIKIAKEGFYESTYQVSRLEESDTAVNREKVFEFVIKEKLNPIAMYAWKKLKIQMPEFDQEFGFDLFKADWVKPFGNGDYPDLYLELSGYWNTFNDKDATLFVRFPNAGDGIASIENDDWSELRSTYYAPMDGYHKEKKWRRARIKNAKRKPGSLDPKIIVVKETDPKKSYAFRVRTKVDEEGNINEANYGKIYGDIIFDGVTKEERYSFIILTYYLNPVVNDRNLEFDLEKNLFEINEFSERPRKP